MNLRYLVFLRMQPLGNLYFDQMNGARSVREDGLGLLGKLGMHTPQACQYDCSPR
jgi:hypothetical protein